MRLRNHYVRSLDRGLAEFSNDFGMEAVYFTFGPASRLDTRSGDRRSELTAALERFALPVVFAPRGEAGAQALHREFIEVEGDEALFAIVEIPGASGAFNVGTGEKFDAHVSALIFIRGDYVFLLGTQDNMGDVAYPSPDADSFAGEVNSSRAAVTAFYATCLFPEH